MDINLLGRFLTEDSTKKYSIWDPWYCLCGAQDNLSFKNYFGIIFDLYV